MDQPFNQFKLSSINSTKLYKQGSVSDLVTEKHIDIMKHHQHALIRRCWKCNKESKYKCPKCLLRSCSVICIKLHKEQHSCNGIRCKTEYFPKDDLTDSTLTSDYRFLEEVAHCVGNHDRTGCVSNHNRTRCTGNHVRKVSLRDLKGMKLQKQMAASMNINLKLLPTVFTRRKQNTTFYCHRGKEFLWHVEWMFSTVKINLSQSRLSDKVSLAEAVSPYINLDKHSALYDPKLKDYSGEVLSFYMKNEDSPSNKVKYYKLNGNAGLQENLHGKTVIEFPCILVFTQNESFTFENCNTII